MIEITGLSVRYGAVDVLRNVSLRMPAGTQVALLGDNGAGKTTLLRALVGLVPFEGHAAVAGFDVRADGLRVRRATGYLPQTPAFPAHLSGAEIVAMFQELRGAPVAVREALAAVGLDAAADLPARQMSGGMLRRLALAVVQIGMPPLLLLDEPASHLDRTGRAQLTEWLGGVRAAGATVVLAAHNLRGLDAEIDRIVVLEDGRVTQDVEQSVLRARRWMEIVTVGPLPSGLPAGVVPLPARNGFVHVKVPEQLLAQFVGALGDRPFQVHEPPLEDLLREVLT